VRKENITVSKINAERVRMKTSISSQGPKTKGSLSEKCEERKKKRDQKEGTKRPAATRRVVKKSLRKSLDVSSQGGRSALKFIKEDFTLQRLGSRQSLEKGYTDYKRILSDLERTTSPHPKRSPKTEGYGRSSLSSTHRKKKEKAQAPHCRPHTEKKTLSREELQIRALQHRR